MPWKPVDTDVVFTYLDFPTPPTDTMKYKLVSVLLKVKAIRQLPEKSLVSISLHNIVYHETCLGEVPTIRLMMKGLANAKFKSRLLRS